MPSRSVADLRGKYEQQIVKASMRASYVCTTLKRPVRFNRRYWHEEEQDGDAALSNVIGGSEAPLLKKNKHMLVDGQHEQNEQRTHSTRFLPRFVGQQLATPSRLKPKHG